MKFDINKEEIISQNNKAKQIQTISNMYSRNKFQQDKTKSNLKNQ